MSLEKYVDQLPLPEVIEPVGQVNGVDLYKVVMKQVEQKLHRDLPKTTVWGYNGVFPGPTFEARTNVPIKVKWINDLPVDNHLLPVDKTVHGAEPPNPEVRTVVHLHGGNVPMDSDGYPEAWFTNSFKQVGPFFTTKIYNYPHIQPAATLWYHDHAIGITRLNVYAGLAGFYLLRDECEDQLNLPRGRYEVPLVIQDRSFNEDGSFFYPSQPDEPVPVFPSIVPEFFGETILVNGKVWPFLEVEPRKYRFRLLNGSNSRFYRMRFSSGQPFIQIGTDVGFLEKPVITNELILGPGERADVIINFTEFAGQHIVLTNDAPSPFPDGDPVEPNTTGQIIQFRVVLPLSGTDTSSIPTKLCAFEKLTEGDATRRRNQLLIEGEDEFGRLILLLEGLRWSDSVTDKPELGDVEIWNLINATPDTHPIHLHLVRFQILDRRPFDVEHYLATREIVYTGPPVTPDPNERGPKDTVRANPGEVTRIITRFEDFTGLYPWHCHILEHEDHEMMRPYEVVEEMEE